jgi:RNA polymerase sigma-70 factor (ECF subfamily)
MPGAGASDLDLVRAVAHGERSALAALYDRYAGLLNQLGRRILRDAQESEDVVHEVFMELWQRAGDYDPDRGAVRTWIMLRMRSRCLDRVRSARMTRSVALSPNDLDACAGAPVELLDETRGPDRARLRQEMGSLPQAQRQVLELGYFEGLSCSEIAERLALPIGTVKSRVAAALDKLRVSMHEVREELS